MEQEEGERGRHSISGKKSSVCVGVGWGVALLPSMGHSFSIRFPHMDLGGTSQI